MRNKPHKLNIIPPFFIYIMHSDQLKLSLLEKTIIALPIPINAAGYSIKNRKSFLDTAKFYWNYKCEKYQNIVSSLQKEYPLDKLLNNHMPLLCYRLMIKAAIKHSNKLSKKDYTIWAKKYPINLDLSLNPKHIPKE